MPVAAISAALFSRKRRVRAATASWLSPNCGSNSASITSSTESATAFSRSRNPAAYVLLPLHSRPQTAISFAAMNHPSSNVVSIL